MLIKEDESIQLLLCLKKQINWRFSDPFFCLQYIRPLLYAHALQQVLKYTFNEQRQTKEIMYSIYHSLTIFHFKIIFPLNSMWNSFERNTNLIQNFIKHVDGEECMERINMMLT